jgi:hypothetical protein
MRGLCANIEDQFRLTRMNRVFKIFGTQEEALHALTEKHS